MGLLRRQRSTAEARLARLKWSDDNRQLVLGNTRFRVTEDPSEEFGPDDIVLVKSRWMIEAFIREAPEEVENVIDLGIFKGGSLLFLQELFQPRRIVGVDWDDAYREPLKERIAERDLQRVIRPYFGVDQSDTAMLSQIMEENFPDGELDLVIDDCSHLYGPTKASLNFLLPRIRPKGLYVIEDWGWAHWPGEMWQGPQAKWKEEPIAVSNLAFELTMTAASRYDIVRRLSVTNDSLYITKGHPPTDPEGFDISACYLTRGRDFPLVV